MRMERARDAGRIRAYGDRAGSGPAVDTDAVGSIFNAI